MENGYVLVMSEWDDGAAHMLWLDSNYPPDADPSKPGVTDHHVILIIQSYPCHTDHLIFVIQANYPPDADPSKPGVTDRHLILLI